MKKHAPVNATAGFTLMELVITVGILCLVMLVFAAHMAAIKDSYNSHEAAVEVNNIAILTEKALMDNFICTKNFVGETLSTNYGGSTAIPSLKHFIPPNISDRVILEKTQRFKYVEVSDIQLRPARVLGTDLRAADLVITMISNTTKGVQTFERSFGLNFNMLNGVIETCAIGNAESDYQNKTCELLSNGRNVFDPVSGMCADRYEYLPVEVGDYKFAECPPGSFIDPTAWDVCSMIPPNQFDKDQFSTCTVIGVNGDGTFNYDCFNPTRIAQIGRPGYPPAVDSIYEDNGGNQANIPVYADPYRMTLDRSTNRCTAAYIQEMQQYLNDAGQAFTDFKVQIKCATVRGAGPP